MHAIGATGIELDSDAFEHGAADELTMISSDRDT